MLVGMASCQPHYGRPVQRGRGRFELRAAALDAALPALSDGGVARDVSEADAWTLRDSVIPGFASVGCDDFEQWRVDPSFVARVGLDADLTEYFPFHAYLIIETPAGRCWTRLAECRRLSFSGSAGVEFAYCEQDRFELDVNAHEFVLLRNQQEIARRSFAGTIGSVSAYPHSFPLPRVDAGGAARSRR